MSPPPPSVRPDLTRTVREPGPGSGLSAWFLERAGLFARGVLAVSLFVTFLGWATADAHVRARARVAFLAEVDATRTAIARRMVEYEQVLRSGVALFDASDEVQRADWRRFVASSRVETVYPGIQGFGWSVWLRPGDEAEVVAQARADGLDRFAVTPPGERAERMTILYLEPASERNQRAYGYDMWSEPVRREAAARARDSGAISLSGRVRLVQETEADVQPGVLMYAPVYARGMPLDDVADRREALLGFVYAAFRARDLMDRILAGGSGDVDVEVYDGIQARPAARLYTSMSAGRVPGEPAIFTEVLQIAPGGRPWTVVIRSSPAFDALVDRVSPATVALAGMLANVVLYALLSALGRGHARVRALAEELAVLSDTLERRVEVRTADLLATQTRIEEVARLDALAAEAATLMTGTDDPARLLQGCAEAAVRYLDAAFSRIWIVEPDDVLALRASAGIYTRLDGSHARIRMGEFKIGRIARDRTPHLTNAVVGDPEVHDQRWAVREGMVAFAGYPLQVNGNVVGVLAVFARRPLSDAAFEGLGRLAQVVALGIQRQRAEAALRDLAETLERRVEARTAELAASEERVRLAFDAAPSGMLKTDDAGRIVLVNAQTEQLFGYTRAEMLGYPVEMLLPDDLRQRHTAWREAWFRQPRPLRVGATRDLRARRKDGTEFPVEVGVTPVSSAQGTRALVTVQDLTERKAADERIRMLTTELETRVAERTAQLEATLREQAQIAYLVMHNLRTPLRAIHARTRILADEARLDGEMRANVDAIAHNAVTLGAQIDDLVRFSTLFQHSLRREIVATDAVLDAALTELEGERQGREIALVRTPLPPCSADPALLQELFRNLLSNAFKFTRTRACAHVEISGAVDPVHGVCFTVRDDGIGFDMRFREKIFGLFQRLNSAASYEGTGCGLALAKRIVELHGGSIDARSEPGCGATFRFCLPEASLAPESPS